MRRKEREEKKEKKMKGPNKEQNPRIILIKKYSQ